MDLDQEELSIIINNNHALKCDLALSRASAEINSMTKI